MIVVAEAQSRIRHHTPSSMATTLPLEAALGFCLSEDIKAERDYPPFDRITHDGIAIFSGSASLKTFPVSAYAAAGNPRAILTGPDRCIEVATGAPLPQGCDTVIPYEKISLKDGVAKLQDAHIKAGDCLHFQGSDKRAGEILLRRQQKIGLHEMAILAANGVAKVPVYEKPAIAILATGNELVETSEPLLPHQIRRSNDTALKAALHLNGFTDVVTDAVRDDKADIRKALEDWLAKGKVIFVTGGVSRGTYDYVPDVLKGLGVKEVFHHVAQRPGKPLWFGIAPKGALVFGLPGNPASCITCLIRYALPAFAAMSGEPEKKKLHRKLAGPVKANMSLTQFLPVIGDDETRQVEASGTHGSGDFIGLQGTDGIIEVPARDADYAAGEEFEFFPWVRP